ncbi:UNVERIFIED_CONTAM: Transposon Tf2-11 polyprotein, partial [Sesamum indicum]
LSGNSASVHCISHELLKLEVCAFLYTLFPTIAHLSRKSVPRSTLSPRLLLNHCWKSVKCASDISDVPSSLWVEIYQAFGRCHSRTQINHPLALQLKTRPRFQAFHESEQLILLRHVYDIQYQYRSQVAFDNLKKAMMTESVLALPDMSKSFVVETDASDYALGGVLMQDGHPVAFESRKHKDVAWRYSVHENELLAVVHCLRLWRQYLLGSPFVVSTDNIVVSYFMSQPKLTSRQARWQELLSEFHFVLEYWAGSSNHVANALSRRAGLTSLESIAVLSSSAVATFVRDRVRELLSRDPAAQGLI